MNELSLFSGAGGGLLGSKMLGWRTIGYVEFNEYCQQVIRARIDDGHLEEAPIFGDIDGFVQSGAAEEYRGFADVVSGGFPCQPFSHAGARAGADDPRNKWPATLDVIRAVRPRFVFMENVPGLQTRQKLHLVTIERERQMDVFGQGNPQQDTRHYSRCVESVAGRSYFGRILGDLAESGYDARWRILSAAEMGAPHKRDRLWIVCHVSDSRPSGQHGRRAGAKLED